MQEVLENDLFKEITSHYEKFYKLPPLTARIYALLVFNNCPEGLTFEALLEIFHASKSSISHSISVLVELKFIEQFKKDNERKRYFRANKNLFLMRLEDVQERLLHEMDVYSKLRSYKQTNANMLFNQEAFDFYIGHLAETTNSLEKTIQNLKLYIRKNEESY